MHFSEDIPIIKWVIILQTGISIATGFFTEPIRALQKMEQHLESVGEKKICKPIILYPAKSFFPNKGKVKTLNEFITARSIIQEIKQKSIQAEEK